MARFPVAEEIRRQIGIPLLMRFGAHDQAATDDSYSFSMRVSPRKVVRVQVELTPADTYTIRWVRFPKGRPLALEDDGEIDDVYVENLRETLNDIFEENAPESSRYRPPRRRKNLW